MDKHLTVLGALFLGVGILGVLGCLAILAVFGLGSFILGSVAATDPSVPPLVTAMPAVFGLFLALLVAVTTIPALIAGCALLKRLPWARTAALIAGVLGLMNIPLGTAVGIYAIWFFLRFDEPVPKRSTPA